jgi:alpha-L-fucosidase
MKVNAESIHGTSANPFKSTPWGRCTMKAIDGGTRLYLHVFDWPQDGKLKLPGLANEITGARLLANRAKVGIEGATLSLPATAPDPIDTVVAVDIKGAIALED